MRLLVAALASLILAGPAWSAQPTSIPNVKKVRSIGLVTPPALPDNFKNFPWVNPDAPKGGEVALGVTGTFDSFNPFIVRGTPAGSGIFEDLLFSNPDEPEVSYGWLADTIELPPDNSWVAYDLRPEAKFWDGTPVTAEDVAWSFNMLRDKGKPLYAQYWADVDHVEVDGPRRVVFRFKTKTNRELPSILGQVPVLPEHWWKGRDFAAPLTEPPLGSGPYKVGRFEFGRTLVMDRVPDYWGANMPFARGLNNFDKIRYEYFRDSSVDFEAFKAGQTDWRQELAASTWATGYDFPAVRTGLVKRLVLKEGLPRPMQGFGMNLRRPLFQDRRVREALAQVFDFEWLNKNLSHGLNSRTSNFFGGTKFASHGLPTGEELALLEPFRKDLPPELFTQEFKLLVTDGSGNNPQGLKRAYELFRQAGYTLRDHKMVDPAGKPVSFELLLDEPVFEKIALPYAQQLARLGIEVRVRTVDPAQYQHRMDSFDYDMTEVIFGESDSPGNEQADQWSCAAAKTEGSGNLMGVCNPAIEFLIGKIISATTYEQLAPPVRALDRVLLWEWYLVPQFYRDSVFVAFWDKFGYPTQPVRTGVEFSSWWIDAAKASKLAAAQGH
jgi:microcin C transport system substrate-binding protein